MMIHRAFQVVATIILVAASLPSLAQSKTISGVVRDANDGMGLPGVTVQIKGTQSGDITGIEGDYTVVVPDENAILVFTYIGYKKVEMAVGARTVIDINLETDIAELSEVVVIGYGTVEAGDVTGVVTKVDEKNFNKGMLTTPEQLIAGKVAGVQITQNSGEPGGGLSIRIRGGSTLGAAGSGGAGPLYVVDGVPLEKNVGVAGNRNPLSFINPADIVDMTILKDASAAAIYGSRGASGVVIITTRSGSSGKPQFTYDGSLSVSEVVDRVSMLSVDEFGFTIERRGPRNAGDIGVPDGQGTTVPLYPGSETRVNPISNTDWLDEVIQTAIGQNHNIGVSFGIKDHTTSRISLNYQNLDGVLNTSNTERIAGSVNLTTKLLDDDLTVSFNSKHALINNRFAPNVVGNALIYAPTQPIFLQDGLFHEWENPLAPANPVGEIARTFNIGQSSRNLINGTIEYKMPFLQGLSAKINYAYDQADGLSQVSTISSGRQGDEGGFTYFEDRNSSNLLEAYLTYEFNTSLGKLDVLGGYSYQDNKVEIFQNLRKNDTVNFEDLNITDTESFIDDSKLNSIDPFISSELIFPLENRLISFWGRVNFDIKDKYLVTATLRRDGSTRFGQDNRWGTFPSLAVGWRILDESFMSGLENTFSNLKFRVSWGLTGNQDFDDYQYVPVYQQGGQRAQYILGQDTINTTRPNAVDQGIKWEATESLNIGLDFGVLNGRLNGSIEYYRKTTSDLILDAIVPIGPVPGDRILTNAGEFTSDGIELVLNSVVIDKEDLRLDVSFNASYNRNEVVALNESGTEGFGIQTGGISGDVGQSIQVIRQRFANPSFLVYKHIRDGAGNPLPDGEDHNGDGLVDDLDIFADQNGDGIINEDDLVVYNSPVPDYLLGLTANLSYKKFDLAMTWRGTFGNYAYNNVFSQFGAFEGVNNSASPKNIHSSAYVNGFTERQLLSDVYVEDASFMKLDNVTIGYRFSPMDKINARLYVTGSNLLILSDYSGIDPEAGGFGGIDNNLYPRSRTYVVGLNVNF